MFKNNLSSALLNLLEEKNISQERLARESNITLRQISNIINRHSNLNISSLEKLCVALDITPNDLLLPKNTEIGTAAKEVVEIRYHSGNAHKKYSPVCPHCDKCLPTEYTAYCDYCFGKLSWHKYSYADITQATEQKAQSKNKI